MNNFQPDKWQLKCLETWYPENHPLHHGMHHPLKKLVGELGEYIDGDAKSQYKDGWEFGDRESELGDCWYYLRILAYQRKLSPVAILKNAVITEASTYSDYEWGLSELIFNASKMYFQCTHMTNRLGFEKEVNELLPKVIILFAIHVLQRGYTLDQLTQSNYEKLVGKDGKGKHGWKSVKEY